MHESDPRNQAIQEKKIRAKAHLYFYIGLLLGLLFMAIIGQIRINQDNEIIEFCKDNYFSCVEDYAVPAFDEMGINTAEIREIIYNDKLKNGKL